jgi:hypothetical protein
MDRTARIQRLNDLFRCGATMHSVFFTEFTITRGVAAHGEDFVQAAMAAVVSYDDFNADNDYSGRSITTTATSSSDRPIRVTLAA